MFEEPTDNVVNYINEIQEAENESDENAKSGGKSYVLDLSKAQK